MNNASKLVTLSFVFFLAISICATFYQTVIKQDYAVVGLGVELSVNGTYAYFIYDGLEYEIELKTHDFQNLKKATLEEIDLEDEAIDSSFISSLEEAFYEAEQNFKFN
jgi:hypothetical protein